MKLFLKEVKDRYIQENFKRINRALDSINNQTGSDGTSTIINNNTSVTQRIPLDGTENITGTIVPDPPSTYDIGSTTNPLRGLYSDEVFIGPNSLYIDGHQAIGIDNITGRLTYSNDADQDLEVKSRGTGKLYIDSEGDIVITSNGNVTINGKAIANYEFGRDTFDIPSQVINSNQIVLGHTPLQNSEMVVLNGSVLTEGASIDYTMNNNVITFNPEVLTGDGLIRVDYKF